ncbi:transposase [Sinorhizobium fredii]|uniref:Uncharacterized protein n=1 Tax=Rhizobium fredii TaxID=380 RepID=A0A2L0H4A0_RHIFR|nr:transposase [Sinorhizobium fredii]AUX76293.1 hypothetical protein NXT3_CH01721 [Sinorhizobium fredii]
MTDKQEDQEFAFVSAKTAEIRAGLDAPYTAEQLQRPMSTRMVHALVAGVTAATSAKLKALTSRLEEVESRGIRYSGCYQRALAYGRGSIVTFASSMWIALDEVPAGVQPGSNGAFWQLAEKGSSRVRKQKDGQS